jgi:hypothetical protein
MEGVFVDAVVGVLKFKTVFGSPGANCWNSRGDVGSAHVKNVRDALKVRKMMRFSLVFISVSFRLLFESLVFC